MANRKAGKRGNWSCEKAGQACRHAQLSRQGVKFSPRGHRDELRNEVESVVQLQSSRRKREGGVGTRWRKRGKRRGRARERDIKVFRVVKVEAAAATSKRPPTAGLWLRLSARVPACVCVRWCTRSRPSRERERSRAETGRASTGELRFRSNRCALWPRAYDPRVPCVRAHVRAPSHTRAFSLHSSSLHGKDNVAASFRTPWNDRVATVSVEPFLLPSFSLFFLLSSIFLLPLPLASSYIEPSDSRLMAETHPGRSASSWNTMNPDEIFSVFFSDSKLFSESKIADDYDAIPGLSRGWIFEYFADGPRSAVEKSKARVKKYFDSAISTVVVVVCAYAREIIYIETRLIWISGELKGAVCVCRGTCQKDCGNARPGKS